jgi:hypothetical protein
VNSSHTTTQHQSRMQPIDLIRIHIILTIASPYKNILTMLLRFLFIACSLHQAAMAFSPILPLPPARSSARSPTVTASSSTTTAQLFASVGDGGAGLSPPWTALSNLFQSAVVRRSQLKKQITDLASATNRGLSATDEQKQIMENLFAQLEALNPTLNPIIVTKNKPSVNGDWSLDYTTSNSILGKGGYPRIGPIIQTIDTSTLSAKNSEIVQYFNLFNVPRSVTAELSPVNGQLTNVKFKKFMVGPVGFNAPDSFRGSLDITYLDEEMRLTRGDKGNIFVLTRM